MGAVCGTGSVNPTTVTEEDVAMAADLGCATEELAVVRRIFDLADASRTGFLSRAELGDAAQRCLSPAEQKERKQVDPDGSELAALFAEMDADRDGRIAFSEFARWWSAGDGDIDSQFVRWWFKDSVRRSFKISKSVKVEKGRLEAELEAEVRKSFRMSKAVVSSGASRNVAEAAAAAAAAAASAAAT